MATGAVSALGELEINKIFGKGINIPKRFIEMLPLFRKEFTTSQMDQMNRTYQTGGRLVIKPTRKQIEGGFLGTLASIRIPMAISLVSKMFGSGLPLIDNHHQIQEMLMYHLLNHMVMVTIHSNLHPFLEVGITQFVQG